MRILKETVGLSVDHMTCAGCSVTLDSGEVIACKVLVGADGVYSKVHLLFSHLLQLIWEQRYHTNVLQHQRIRQCLAYPCLFCCDEQESHTSQ